MENESHKSTLFGLINQEMTIFKQIQENGGELSPELESALSEIQFDRSEKIDACKYLIEQFDFRAASLKSKEDEIREVRKRCEAVVERIKARIKEGMKALEVAEISGNDYRFKMVTNKEPRLVIDADTLPEDYKTAVTTWVPDKERIDQDIQLGLEIPGVTLVPIIQLRSYVMPAEPKRKPKGLEVTV